MNLYDRLQLLILQNGYETEEFCLRFGMHAISELPLVFLPEIARALNTTPEAILLGKAQRKPFPTDIKLLILDVELVEWLFQCLNIVNRLYVLIKPIV
jgi:hypothetical protein